MLPTLIHGKEIAPNIAQYLSHLSDAGFSGDIEMSYASRLAVATDNSVYQALPKAVIFPKKTSDIALMMELAQATAFKSIRFAPRGGGTGTNGQALTHDLVVDLSRHLRGILEINTEQAWVRVEAGVVKDALNEVLKPLGFFFSPDLSTSNRATIGGMINTDASGQGSLRYGKTSDHVLGLTAVLYDGRVIETKPMSLEEIFQNQAILAQDISAQDVLSDQGALSTPKALSEEQTKNATLLQTLADICQSNRIEIDATFPALNRFLTGYDLKNAYQPAANTFDLTRLLCGSEGTLAFITEAKLNITPLPLRRVLVNVMYDSFDSALRHAPLLVKANALSVETIDSRVLNLAKQDVIWHQVKELVADVPDEKMQGINLIEFASNNTDEIENDIAHLVKALDKNMLEKSAGVIGYQICEKLDSIERIYAMRKKAVGLLGAVKGAAKPVAFAEDTCVPPENLADFIAEFRTLLDKHQLNYGMFGHVDAGVLHVRPALDLCDPKQELLMKSLSDEVAKLVAKYGGLMWGEHGKGYRSEYGPNFFGAHLFGELRKVKAAFDPDNRINPGKICTPFGSHETLVTVDDTKRGFYDRQIDIKVRESYWQAMECNGNGLCFNYDKDALMCPSMKVSYDRRHSPKGRAGILREWLRLLAELGVDPIALEKQLMENPSSLPLLIEKFKNSWNKKKVDDFSHEVMEVMNGCLACKACATQCPLKVDVPSFRSRFIQLYHSRYLRPAKDHLVAHIETLLPLMAIMPRLVNGITQPKWSKLITQKTIGYVDTPLLTVPTLAKRLKKHSAFKFDLNALKVLAKSQIQNYVLIVQDPFTSYYDASVVEDFVYLLEKLGKKPIILPFKPNGKAQYIKGFLKEFVKTAKDKADFLNQLQSLNIPMVGVDPAMVLCYRDEYEQMLKEGRGDFHVQTAHEYLLTLLANLPKKEQVTKEKWYLFAHCTEKTKLPNAEKEWGTIFTHFGQTLVSIPVGCCGMAGTFGHEADKYAQSKAIYELSWSEKLNALPKAKCMATGYSCRSQVKRFEREALAHPVQVLLKVIEKE